MNTVPILGWPSLGSLRLFNLVNVRILVNLHADRTLRGSPRADMEINRHYYQDCSISFRRLHMIEWALANIRVASSSIAAKPGSLHGKWWLKFNIRTRLMPRLIVETMLPQISGQLGLIVRGRREHGKRSNSCPKKCRYRPLSTMLSSDVNDNWFLINSSGPRTILALKGAPLSHPLPQREWRFRFLDQYIFGFQ